MKKILSCLMVLVMLFSCTCVVYAAGYKKLLFEKNFIEYYTEMGYEFTEYDYDELYYHLDDNEETDWCLIRASFDVEPGICHGVFDDIIITGAASLYPLNFALGVYDAVADEFYDICTAWNMDFPQLKEVFYNTMTDKNVSYNYGEVHILGDVDKNGDLDVMDATKILKYITQLIPRDDMLGVENSLLEYGPNVTFLSDFNKNGYCDVDDATGIQKKIVNIE